MKVRFLFAWYDLWVGAFWDGQKRRLYVLPVPCLGVVIDFARGPKPVDEVQELKHVVAALLDAMKWHLRGAQGTDQRSLDIAQHAFERAFLRRPAEDR